MDKTKAVLGIKPIGTAAAITLLRKSKPGDGTFACGKKGSGGGIC